MKRLPHLCLLVAFAALTSTVPATVASAQGPAGSFGAGVESPLAVGPLIEGPQYLRLPGLSLRYQVSEGFGLQLITAVRTVTFFDAGDNTRATFGGAYFRAHIRVVEAENLQLGVFGGAGFGGLRVKQGPADAQYRVLSFEGGLRPEIFLADGRVSLHFQVGMSFAISLADAGGPLEDGFGFGFGRNADLLGNAGLTIWFGGGGSRASSEPAASPPPPAAPPPDWESGTY